LQAFAQALLHELLQELLVDEHDGLAWLHDWLDVWLHEGLDWLHDGAAV
jgi:hypothetical protein